MTGGILAELMRMKEWPDYIFNPGPPKALHAVAVISACFNAFERIMFDLYTHHLDRKKYDREITEKYFLCLDELKKLDLVNDTFKRFEKSLKVKTRVKNLVDYFAWCAEVRHSVIHGEVYPTIISSDTNLNLAKRLGRKSRLRGYLSVDIETLRYFADRIEDGRVQASKINFYLRYRDTRPSARSDALKRYGPEPLPKTLRIPKPLKLSISPHYGPGPQYQR